MIIEPGGGKGGFKDYLENGIKAGRDFHRNELDQRVPLFGDLDVFEVATSLHQGNGRTYDHFTISFSENNVTNEMLQIAANEFREHALSAWPEEERHRIPFYAEAHRPKLQSYINSETGEDVTRFIHVHVGMGRHDLLTGNAIEPLGFLGQKTDNLKYIDAFQESFNSRHGFTSPKDNPRITPENAIDTLARYTGMKPNELGTQNEKKSALEIILQKEIIEKNITTWEGFGKLLATHGAVSKMNKGRFDECYRVKQAESARAMRLKGVFFQRQFIERTTSEKIFILQEKARSAYLEQMQPRKEPGYVAGILTEWQQTKSKEFRYLNTGSSFYKNVYLPADGKERLEILNKLERNNHGIPRPSTVKFRKITPARNRLPGMPIRDLDGIQSRSEMLLRGDTGMDVRAEFTGNKMGVELRQADGRDRATETHSNGNGQVVQPSSVLARVQADLQERYERAADKDRYAEIKKYIDCNQLLASLSHSHGLNPLLYQVTAAKDGTPRIQCGSRALTPSDFLTHELGFPWKEAAPILRQTYEHQIGKKVTAARGKVTTTPLWGEFKAEQLAGKPALEQRLKAFDADTKRHWADLFSRLKIEQQKTLTGLTGTSKKAAQSLAKLKSATAKAEFNDERRALRKALQPTQANAWRIYLQACAQAGHEEALAVLRMLNDTARVAPVQSITGTIYLDDDDEKKRRRLARESTASILKMLMHTVERNGDVTYHQHGRAVMRDEGQHLAVLDVHSEDAITAALLLGREKFGTTLTLTGSQEFQRRVVTVAVAQGIQIKFVDPQLETLRVKLTESKRQPMQQRVTQAPQPLGEAVAPALPPSTKSAQRGIEPAVAEPTKQVQKATPAQRMERAMAARALVMEANKLAAQAKQQAIDAQAASQDDYDPGQEYSDDEQQLTAAQWSAGQPRLVVPPYKSGDAAVAYVVLHVAHDGIVIDHGRDVAVYPAPQGIDLQAGDRVVIDRNGLLNLPNVLQPGMPGLRR